MSPILVVPQKKSFLCLILIGIVLVLLSQLSEVLDFVWSRV